MITITNIRAFEIDNNTKNITNNLILEWKNLSRQVNNIKQLKRFKHLLAWYIRLNNKTKVEFLFEYKELVAELENNIKHNERERNNKSA